MLRSSHLYLCLLQRAGGVRDRVQGHGHRHRLALRRLRHRYRILGLTDSALIFYKKRDKI